MSTGAAPPGQLIIARHGRSEANAAGRIQGHLDTPLDRCGEIEAATLAADLAGRFPAPAVAAVVTSDLERARATAGVVARATHAPLLVDPRLREVDAGRWAGHRRARVAEADPGRWAAWLSGEGAAPGADESLNQAGRRVAVALLAAWARAEPAGRPGGVVVAVAHGLVLRAALSRLTAAGLVAATGAAFDDRERPIHLGNAEWAELVPGPAGRPLAGGDRSSARRPARTGPVAV